jgi:tyrosine-protein kinase Etk/Wzc
MIARLDHQHGASTSSSSQLDGEISFAAILSVLRRRRKVIVITALGVAAAATATALMIPPKYTAESVILTPQQGQPSLSALAQVAGTGSAMGLPGLSLLSGFGIRNPSDLYVGILGSRTIADALIAKYEIQKAYHDDSLYATRKHLAQNTTIRAGKDTLIRINVSDRDPKRAADLANGYVAELSLQNSTLALTEASQRRLFFEQQLVREKDLLANAEVALRNTEQSTGLIVPTGQYEALIRSASLLRAEILSREAQLAGLKTYAADENPRLQAITRELATFRAELAKLERGNHVAGSPEVPVGALPQAGLEYIRKFRDVKYHEALFEALSKQLEAARLDEAKASSVIQIVDLAVTPEKKSWPPRTLIVLGSTALAVLLSAMYVLVKESASLYQDAHEGEGLSPR